MAYHIVGVVYALFIAAVKYNVTSLNNVGLGARRWDVFLRKYMTMMI